MAMPDVLPAYRAVKTLPFGAIAFTFAIPGRPPIGARQSGCDAMLRSWTSPARCELDELVELSHYCDFNQLATFVDGSRPTELYEN